MDPILFFWLTLAICFLIVELSSPGLFFFLSFFFGSLAAVGAVLAGYDGTVQIALFLAGSAFAMIGIKWWAKKHHRQSHGHASNIYALQGKVGVVTKLITPEQVGQVKVGGEIWSARGHEAVTLPVGAQVTVVRVQGVHVIVKAME
jgi:membrane protein implicated in regulation of membrane protease activity